jgi:ubiquinone/menaquinone biosynthesis C-methylase UbiE
MNARAFDAVAASYDRCFTDTAIGRELRQAVWDYFETAFPSGSRILEVNCGTGEDAVRLAKRNVRVCATDASPAMLKTAAQKAASEGVSGMIDFRPMDISAPAAPWPERSFDGAFSNFGGLNCVRDLAPLARMLGRSVRPGGRWIGVVMGRWCAWEIAWHLLRLRPRAAWRRLAREGAEAKVGNGTVRVWYPPAQSLRRTFAPEFRLRHVLGVGVLLPPSYLWEAAGRGNGLMRMLRRFEGKSAGIPGIRGLGDHVLYDFERVGA